MEATGSYWKPVWYVLEDRGFELKLVNAAASQDPPGPQERRVGRRVDRRAARTRPAARQFRAPSSNPGAAGPDPLPQAADSVPHRGVPTHREDPRRRRHQVGRGRLGHLGRVGPGDAEGARRRRTRPRTARGAGQGRAAQQDPRSCVRRCEAGSGTITPCWSAWPWTTPSTSTPPSPVSTPRSTPCSPRTPARPVSLSLKPVTGSTPSPGSANGPPSRSSPRSAWTWPGSPPPAISPPGPGWLRATTSPAANDAPARPPTATSGSARSSTSAPGPPPAAATPTSPPSSGASPAASARRKPPSRSATPSS